MSATTEERSAEERLLDRLDELEELVAHERGRDGDAAWVYERVYENLREREGEN
ncbi:hypothetical protein ACFQL1_16095 [Halomicroarcula sp. GCM10025709]|uniref:hypothetical protein n=1 Tax=Haloarcula TaxID=2237 RepID=UPI0024C28F06|nr:hypothetical protein [Halomicroarcula sp. YJ-61-S]